MAAEGKKIKVLMLPWLGHGHITPYLELAKKLSSRNFHVYFCSTPVNLNSIKNKNKNIPIKLVELHLPSSPELLPHLHTTNGLPPHLMPALKTAFESSADQFSSILESLQPDLVIYDFNQPWAAEIAASQGIPAVEFAIIGAAMVAFGLHVMKSSGDEEFPFPEIYLRNYEKRKMLQSQGNNKQILHAMELSKEIFLLKTCTEIEGRFIDHLSLTCNKKFVPVGPLVPDNNDDDDSNFGEIKAWLDEKEKASVIFASFGSEYFPTEKERHAISHGLEKSGINFIWAVRFPAGEGTGIREALPEGFPERVESKNRGKILLGWAPQERILKHSSVGAFLSHCGWCSVMESLIWGGGVPIVAVPMHSDQPVNARVVAAAGIGVEAARDEEGELRGEEIAAAIRKVMVEEGCEDFRRRAKELGGKLAAKGDEEIDDVCTELAKICQKIC